MLPSDSSGLIYISKRSIVTKFSVFLQQITLVTPYKASKVKENVREVVLPFMDMANTMPNVFENKLMGPLHLVQKAPYLCTDALADPQTQNLLKDEFDLAILSMFFSDCLLSVVHQLKASCLKWQGFSY